MLILGPPSAPLEVIRTNLAYYSPHPIFMAEMLPALWAVAVDYRIDPPVMIGQAGLETGFGKFGGVIDASFHNTCGLKIAQGGDDDDPDAHQRFPDWYVGAEAQAQHLYAYMQLDLPQGRRLVDPRWRVVRGNPRYMPGITEVEGLDAWATKPNNGQRILAVVQRLIQGVQRPPRRFRKLTTLRSAEP